MADGAAAGSPGRRLRRISNTLIVLGVAVILYAGLILAWGDPVTWLWAHWQQRAKSRVRKQPVITERDTEYSRNR